MNSNFVFLDKIQSDKFIAEKLWESEESLRVLMNSNPEAVFILDTKGNFIAANEKTALRFGKSIQELIGSNVFTYLTPEIARERKLKVNEVIKTGKPLRFDDSRNNRYFDNYLHPVFDSNGTVIRIAVWVIDFTERKQVIDALKASEEKFRELAENIQDIFWIRTGNEVIYVSPAYEIICGKSCDSLYKDPNSFLYAVHPEDFQRVLNSFSSEQYLNDGLFNEEFRIIRPDGNIKWIWAKTFPIKTNGKLTRTVGIAEDITLIKEYEEKIHNAFIKEKELNDLKSRFISMVSHEFRTPLGLILSSSELLQNFGYKWNKEKRDELFEKIKSAVENLTGLIKDVIALNEEESGLIKIMPENIDLAAFLQELINEIKFTFKETPSIHFQRPKKMVNIFADKKLLRQIFVNLITNAVKYTHKKKNIFIIISKNKQSFKIIIKDEGMGIPEDDLKNIFEPFIRAKNASEIKGSGLGLSIVKRAVTLQNGEMSVSSSLNEGSVFTVILPVKQII